MYDLCEVCAAYQSCILSGVYFKCAFKIRSTSAYEEYELSIEGYARVCTTHVWRTFRILIRRRYAESIHDSATGALTFIFCLIYI